MYTIVNPGVWKPRLGGRKRKGRGQERRMLLGRAGRQAGRRAGRGVAAVASTVPGYDGVLSGAARVIAAGLVQV